MGFERCHPAVNLIYFAAVIAGTLIFKNPVFLGISYVCAFVYSVKRGGRRALVFDLVLIPLIAVFAYYYSSFEHFGMTVIGYNRVGNSITLESIVYGAVLGFMAAAVLMWFSCVHSVFTADKVVYLFGRVSPLMALFLSIMLRMVPRIKKEAGRINTAQKGIGLGAGQGGIIRRMRNCIRIFSMMISWTIEAFASASDSMRSRGSMLRGRRAFSIYRFDNRDRAYVVVMFFFMSVTVAARMLSQTGMKFSPQLIFPPVTAASFLFYICWAAMCLMPLALELWTERSFIKARRQMASQDAPVRL